jgi:hypothetical protein
MPKITLIAALALLFLAFTTRQSPAVLTSPENVVTSLAASASHDGTASFKRAIFEEGIEDLYNAIGLSSHDLDFSVFRLAMIGYYGLKQEQALNAKELITIIDFSRPSTEKRLFTIDLKNKRLKFHSYVAHGRNTGQNIATDFSNVPHSNQSSLGFYVTAETYVGSKGYSLRLDGVEAAFNSNIRSRAVVVHGADYVTKSWIQRYGRLGRSEGCPALPPAISRQVIDAIKDGTAIFTYYPDSAYLRSSKYLQLDNMLQRLDDDALRGLFQSATRAS